MSSKPEIAKADPVPKEKPTDPTYKERVRAADSLKYGPDQQDIPKGVSMSGPEHDPETARRLREEEFERQVDEEMSKSRAKAVKKTDDTKSESKGDKG